MARIERKDGTLAITLLVSVLGLIPESYAALSARLGGLAYYDDVLDITWLKDANLASSNTFGLPYDADLGDHPLDPYAPNYTEQILSDGRMTWGAALHWIDAMNAGNYLGFDGWRLPIVNDTGVPGCGSDIGTECGAWVLTGSAATTVYSELASLFYDTLGNVSTWDQSGHPIPGGGLTNTGPFENIKGLPYMYWTGTVPGVEQDLVAFGFDFIIGYQDIQPKYDTFYGWAVHPGDMAATPLPAAAWLMGSGVAWLAGFRRRKRMRR